ncbi:MAG: DUF3048 domain-containing protein [Candidatus Shapirobacteria bacterium]|jgi:hypothetical protein
MSKNLRYLSYFGLYLVVSGLSFIAFSRLLPSGSIKPDSESPITNVTTTPAKTGFLQFSGPKTETCPLTGQLYTKEEKNLWSVRRPLVVMIENHADSRPQSGLNMADVVYEAIAEGGITRFMAVYYCAATSSDTNYDVGPVRSARTYFLDLASEYADYPLYAHVGGANCSAPKDPVTGQSFACTTDRRALAIEQISDYGWTNKDTRGDLDQFSLSYKVCRREPERTGEVRDTEHTMYCSSKELWNTAATRGLTNITESSKKSWDKNFSTWKFGQAESSTSGSVVNIAFDFWSGYKDYSVAWNYDPTTKMYSRLNGGKKHIDFVDGQVISTKNLLVQFVPEIKSIDVHGHNLYKVVGSGKGILFQNGSKEEITWSKASRTARTIYKNASSKEVDFVPGKIWIELLPFGNQISYEAIPQS